jgi:hypothetical protein
MMPKELSTKVSRGPARASRDGGFTGANMDRPALTKLLQAVEAGELDCVVVYKVDRLSRSLLDFTRGRTFFGRNKYAGCFANTD